MYRKIILPTDGSEASRVAVEFGLELARFHGASVVITSVLDLSGVYPVPMGAFIAPGAVVPAVADESEELLARLKNEAIRLGVTATTALRRGDPGQEIVALAKEEGADLILMAAHQHGRIAALLLGSVSQQILRDAPCPVQVIGETVIERSPVLKEAAALARASGAPVDAQC